MTKTSNSESNKERKALNMPQVMEAIDKMTVKEKFDTMNYLWSSLSESDNGAPPEWHRRELAETEKRVDPGRNWGHTLNYAAANYIGP